MVRERGTVKWFDEVKNYGFITPDVGHKEVFFHRNDLEVLEETIDKGSHVEYEIGPGSKGPQARKITIVAEESTP